MSAFTLNAGGLTHYTFNNRGDLRTSGAKGQACIVEGLGLFSFIPGSKEPDDDETCFAASGGAWELKATDPDWVVAQLAPEFQWRFLFGTFTQSISSLVAGTVQSLTATVVGALVGDSVIVSTGGTDLGSATTAEPFVSYYAYVSAPNTIKIVFRNSHPSTTWSLNTGTWSVLVIKQ
jgi:hypothetical protein